VRLSGHAATVAVALALAACTSGPPRAMPGPRSAPRGPAAASTGAPACSVATGTARHLPAGLVRLSPVPGDPFGVAVTADGRWSFVSYLPTSQGAGDVGVFAASGSASPRLVHQIPVPQGLGMALTPGGRYLLVAEGTGVVVLSGPAAEQGAGNAVLGTLSSGGPGQSAGGGAIEVAVSPDGRFAFASLEASGAIAVFDLQRALAGHFRTSGFVGDIPMGIAPVGMAVAPNGDWLYATSELNPAPRNGPGPAARGQGSLSVISLRKAETDPPHSVVSRVDAGCSPVRVVTSASGGTVWVTARESDMLLGFSAARLRTDPPHSLIARVRVGEAPVGLALVDDGQRVVVADSNRFQRPGATASLAVVNVAAALAGKPALAGYLPAGGFPRQMALEPGGRTLLVTNFGSRQLETVNVANLP
jgi:DNA-binding beta-propeller fold protein YncE